jgi:hypothetical protein
LGRRFRARRAQKNNQAVERKKNRSIITTVLAFGLVMFVIPMAFGPADVVNGAVAGTSQQKILLTNDLGHQYASAYINSAVFAYHKDGSGTYNLSAQTTYSAEVLGTNYNQVVLSYATTTEHATRAGSVAIQSNVSTQWLIAHKIVYVKFSIQTASVKEVALFGSSYAESGGVLLGSNTGGIMGRGKIIDTVFLPVTPYEAVNATWAHAISSTGMHMNATPLEWRYVLIDVDATNLLKADTFLGSPTNSTFVIVLGQTGDTDATSLIHGTSIKFRIEFFGSAVSGIEISEYMVGGLGVLLILGSAVASPWVNPTRRG